MKDKKVKGEYVTDRNPYKKEEENNPVILRSGEEIFNPEELFGNESGNNSDSMVVKELFNPKNPKVKSELTDREIKIISRLYSMSKLYYEPRGTTLLKEVLDEFILERMSKDRKSRAEFVEAHKESKKNMENGFFNRLLGGQQG